MARRRFPTSRNEIASPQAAISEPGEDPAATAHPEGLPHSSLAPVDAHPVAPKHVAVELANLFSHTRSFVIVKTSCEFYGIDLHKNQFINRARLSLHIVGVTRDRVGEKKWEELSETLAYFINTCRVTNTPTVSRWNKFGPVFFPNAWIPCISSVEAMRQCIKRLLDENRIPIPRDSLDLSGMEGPREPTFHLHGCFDHLLSREDEKLTRFLYIEKALSCWGVYPYTSLFQEIGAFLGNILTGTVITKKSAGWNKVRVLNALGMGVELQKDRQGKSQKRCILRPWGIELDTPYDIDFLMSIWLGHVIHSGLVEGRRRMTGPSEAGWETAPTPLIEDAQSGYDGEDDCGRYSDGVMEQAGPSTSHPFADAHEHVHRGRPAGPQIHPVDAMPITNPPATPSKSPGKRLASPSLMCENYQHKRTRSCATAMDIDQLFEDSAVIQNSEHNDEGEDSSWRRGHA